MKDKAWIKEMILVAVSIGPAVYVLWKKHLLSTKIVVRWDGDSNPVNYSALGKVIALPLIVGLITFLFSKFNVKRGGSDVYYVRLFLAIIFAISAMMILSVNNL